MIQLPAPISPDLQAEISDLARAYRRASGPVMALMQRMGGSLESQLRLLPDPLRAQIDRSIIAVLTGAHHIAARTEGGPDLGRGGVMAAALATGAAGGAGGIVTALVEVPVTITVFLHAIRAEARAAGFDPDQAGIRAACLEVFTAATPLAEDDGMNTAFLSARMALTGPALQKIIATVAPRLGVIMGQKLAAQTMPLLGAASGAAINAAYLRYFREIARIRFALMRLSIAHGGEAVTDAFTRATTRPLAKPT